MSVLAYFLTWTTYGTWLPGDARGWVQVPGVGHPATGPPARTPGPRAHGRVGSRTDAVPTDAGGTDDPRALPDTRLDAACLKRSNEPRSRGGDGRPRPGRGAGPIQGVVF